jgi:hypothetical protein
MVLITAPPVCLSLIGTSLNIRGAHATRHHVTERGQQELYQHWNYSKNGLETTFPSSHILIS